MAGFTYFDEKPNTEPTTAEILASLTDNQKLAVLDGFAEDTPVTELKHKAHIASSAIIHLKGKIREIQATSRALMRGDTPPPTANALIEAVKDLFVDDFTETHVTAILTKMVEYSKHDGSGTRNYYRSEVKK